ncbi:arylsulfotransferase family protein [Natronomonas sp. EA1]|uniref:arylsulfotransferase family protein n=1 Tax=Natronomonas sp. EA1 TaxID=3421655 RepID=UPI003EC08478
MDLPPRRTLVRAATVLLVLVLLTPSAMSAATYEETSLQPGTIESPANGSTVVGIQGFHFSGQGSEKKPARVVSASERGNPQWTYLGEEVGAAWVYDVDPLANGNLLVVSTKREQGTPLTTVYELDPETRERVWTETLHMHDTHDVDLLPNGDLLIANMRNWNASHSRSDDRLVVYNRSTDEITWEWLFREHYPNSTDGGFNEDWTHVNDVDRIDEHRVLASPRNFDQVIVVNRTTDEIEMRLGADGNHEILYEQHNPDFLVSEDGHPTIVVADSENDRVVEYERRCSGDPMDAPPADCTWERTWEVGADSFNWPRDADRLPNGNTLITDSLNNRVVEVTPQGKIVWEFYATWGPYDAERPAMGGSSRGPTIADQNATGSYALSNSAGLVPGTGDRTSVEGTIRRAFTGTPLEAPGAEFARTWAHLAPWVMPVWMTGWDLLYALLAVLVLLGWGLTEALVHRQVIRARAVALTRRFA